MSVLGAALTAEERLTELIRLRARSGAEPPRGGQTGAFIHRQNIANYRALLESKSLGGAQRRSIEKLLQEEEAKLAPAPQG